MLEAYILPILSALLLFLLCQAVGWPLLPQKLPIAPGSLRMDSLVRLLTAFGVGLWVVSIAVLLWGATVGLSATKILMLWIALVLSSCRSIRGMLAAYRETFSAKLSNSEKVGITLILLITGWALAFALVPPMMTDTVRYHFGVPHRWLLDGAIRELPHFSEQHLVMAWQHAVMLLLGLEQPVGAKVFMFLAFPLTLVALGAAVFAVSRKKSAALFSIFILGFTPTFFGNSVLGGVDAGLAFFAAMTLLFLFSENDRKWIWVGIFSGLALCTKWQGAAVVVAAAACAIWQNRRGAGFRAALSVLLAAAIVYIPWAARNMIWSGDPFYPFLSRLWDVDAASVAEHFNRSMANYGLSGESWWQYLLYPLHLTLGDRFESRVGWYYMVLLPFCLILARRELRLRPILLFAAVAFLVGLAMGQLPRFWMPVWVAFAAAGGMLWLGCGERARLMLLVLLVVSSVWNVAEISLALNQRSFAPLSYHRRPGGAADFHAAFQSEWRAAEWVRGRRSQNKSMLVGLDGNLFWTTPVVVDGPYDRKLIVEIARETKTAAEMADRLKEQGIGLVVIDSGRAERLDHQFGYMGWDPASRARVREFFATQIVRRYTDGSIQIGEIR